MFISVMVLLPLIVGSGLIYVTIVILIVEIFIGGLLITSYKKQMKDHERNIHDTETSSMKYKILSGPEGIIKSKNFFPSIFLVASLTGPS